MEEINLTAVYSCDTSSDLSNGNTDAINSPEVLAYAANLPGVSDIWLPSDISLTDPEQVAKKLKKNNLKRIVIAGSNAGMHKSFFSRAMVLAGNNPEDVILASFQEYGANHKGDVERAKAIVACAVYGVPFENAAVPEELPVNPNTLVIGGGIAGIQASLEIAASKNTVYLVEKSPTIGGHMAMFDKTFRH